MTDTLPSPNSLDRAVEAALWTICEAGYLTSIPWMLLRPVMSEALAAADQARGETAADPVSDEYLIWDTGTEKWFLAPMEGLTSRLEMAFRYTRKQADEAISGSSGDPVIIHESQAHTLARTATDVPEIDRMFTARGDKIERRPRGTLPWPPPDCLALTLGCLTSPCAAGCVNVLCRHARRGGDAARISDLEERVTGLEKKVAFLLPDKSNDV